MHNQAKYYNVMDFSSPQRSTIVCFTTLYAQRLVIVFYTTLDPQNIAHVSM